MSLTGDVLKDIAKGLLMDTALASVTGGGSLLFTSSQLLDFEDGRLKIDLASGEYKKTEDTKDITTQKSAIINTSDGLNINSAATHKSILHRTVPNKERSISGNAGI